MPKRRIPIHASTFGARLKDLLKDEGKEARRTRVDGNIKSKIFVTFCSRQNLSNTDGNYFDYSRGVGILKGFVKLAIKRKYVKIVQS